MGIRRTLEPFQRGKTAAQGGAKSVDNPYAPESWSHEEWRRGHDAARFTVTSDNEPEVRRQD